MPKAFGVLLVTPEMAMSWPSLPAALVSTISPSSVKYARTPLSLVLPLMASTRFCADEKPLLLLGMATPLRLSDSFRRNWLSGRWISLLAVAAIRSLAGTLALAWAWLSHWATSEA